MRFPEPFQWATRRLGLALVSAVFLPAAYGTPTADPRFNVQTHFAQGWNTAWAGPVAAGGFGGVRDELYWSSIETTPGQYSFPAQFDAYMAALQSDGIAPLIELDFANPNYDGGNTPYDTTGFNAYAAYALQVLQHYGSQIKAVEIWNEYDGSFCTGPAASNRPATYTQMLETAYSRIKAARPDVTVAAGSTAWVDLAFFNSLFYGGALPSMDVLSLHPYRYTSPPEGLQNDIASLQTLTRIYNGGQAKPIWVTEIGWYPHTSTGPADATITNAVQAEYAVRAYALLLSAGVQRVYWYLESDDPSVDNGVDLGLLSNSLTAAPKPAYTAVTNLIAQLNGAPFVKREGPPNSFYSLLFQQPGGPQVRVVWSTTPVTVYPQGVQSAVDLYGNPLATSGGVSVGPSPIYLTGTVTGLPGQAGSVLADTLRDFAGAQGNNGWTLGYTIGGVFTAAPTFSTQSSTVPDWTAGFPWFYITAADQLPSATGSSPVVAVRRWTSTYSGRVELIGQFSTEQTGGDGVGASILVNGKPLFRKLLGGSALAAYAFDLKLSVQQGTTIDFAVDPGPGTNNSYDATAVSATISTTQ